MKLSAIPEILGTLCASDMKKNQILTVLICVKVEKYSLCERCIVSVHLPKQLSFSSPHEIEQSHLLPC